MGVERTLQYSTDGLLKLTYKGPLDGPTGTKDTEINFVFTVTESVCFTFSVSFACTVFTAVKTRHTDVLAKINFNFS